MVRKPISQTIAKYINFPRAVNMLPCRPSEGSDVASLPERERKALADSMSWLKTGTAYAMEHGTRPATIGLALSSNPLALLAW